MSRLPALLILLTLVACEEPEPPAPEPWRVASADVEEGIVIERGEETRTVTLGSIRLPEWTPERDLYRDHVQEALAEAAVGRTVMVTGEDDAADLRGDGRWVNRELVLAGWARPAEGAAASLERAEATAREEAAGGWGEAMRDEAVAWLRRRADDVVVPGAPEASVERARRWARAREEHGEVLSFFEIALPDEPPDPATCRDRLRASLEESGGGPAPARASSALLSGEELYRVVALPPDDEDRRLLTCRRYAIRELEEGRELAAGWEEDGGRVLEHLAFELREEPAAVEITAARRERGDETETRTADGVLAVGAALDGGLVVGGMPWLSDRDACLGYLERTLRTLAPECLAR